MNNPAFLYEAFERYYDEGMKAREAGEESLARVKLLRAAEMMYKLALVSTGEMKAAREKRADRIVRLANNPGRVQSSPEAGESGAKQAEKKAAVPSEETLWNAEPRPSVRFADVAGLEEVKGAVMTRIILPKKHPEIYRKFNKKIGGGVLMYGPPGTGKSLVARAIAGEVGAAFYSVRCSDVVSKWFGEAERNIKNLFETARADGEAVIFFDEFEALGAKRNSENAVMSRLIPELLAQIQGFSDGGGSIMLLAATNRPWDVDTAFLRPGRFNELLYVPLPDEAARLYIVERSLKNVPLDPEVDLARLAAATEGYNGADVAEVCEQLKNGPILRALAGSSIDDERVTPSDVAAALAKVKSSVARSDLALLEQFRRDINAV